MKSMKFIPVFISLLLLSLSHAFSQSKILMIVDVQKQFYENKDFETAAAEMVENINGIIDKTKPENIVYIKATMQELSISLKGFKAVPVLPAPDLDPNLNVVNNNIFTKTKADAFSLDELCTFINEHNTKDIIVTGLMAEECVYSTVKGGLKKGYNIFIVPEAITGNTPDKKDKAIQKMVKKGAVILPINNLLQK